MVYAPRPAIQSPNPVEDGSLAALLDPALLQAARDIYRTFYEVHPDEVQRPLGVAIDRFSFRGKLIFNGKPVLLPKECFIPISQIEPGLR
ncbi:hypothetical protein [Leptolyngbya ohadii]|uniref:hypothetical protein n=1 Tax=Leptolyngbya ohadii TaxID=1962290 RepID=UPI000B59DAA4|nr:hypothetical protein [Leptolyngbya ohadii]